MPSRSAPDNRRGSLASRVLRRLRSLPMIFRPSTPQYRSVRDRVPTPHPLDGIGGLSIASASSDGVHVGIWTPIASPGYPERNYGHLATAGNTPVRLSSPTPRQLALNPTADDLEQLRLALGEQRHQHEAEAEADVAVDPADLDGDTLVGPEDEAPSELEFDDELDGATLVSDHDSTMELLRAAAVAGGETPPDPNLEIDWDLYFPPPPPPSIIPRVLRRVRRGLVRAIS